MKLLNRVMFFRTFTAIGLILFALSFSSCGKAPENEYAWFQHADEIAYSNVNLAPDGAEPERSVHSLRKVGEVEIDGDLYAEIRGGSTDAFYVSVKEDGIYKRLSVTQGTFETLVLPIPTVVGQKWVYDTKEESGECRVVSIEDVMAGGQQYKQCVKVEFSGSRGSDRVKSTRYYAPGVGLVREYFEILGEHRETREDEIFLGDVDVTNSATPKDASDHGLKASAGGADTLSRDPTAEIRSNLDKLGTAFDEYMQQKGLLRASYEDLVGPGKYIEALKGVAGETYQQEFQSNGNISATLPDGNVIYLYERTISVSDQGRVASQLKSNPRVHELLGKYVKQAGSVAILYASLLNTSKRTFSNGWDCYEMRSPEFVYEELPITEAQRLNFGNSYVKEKVEIYFSAVRMKYAESQEWTAWKPENVVRGREPLFVIEIEGHKGSEKWKISRANSLTGSRVVTFGIFNVVEPKGLTPHECRQILSSYVEIRDTQASVNVVESGHPQSYTKALALTYELNGVDFKGEEIAVSPYDKQKLGITHRKLIRMYCSSYRYHAEETGEMSEWKDGTSPEILAKKGRQPIFKVYVEERDGRQVVNGVRYVEGRDARHCKFAQLKVIPESPSPMVTAPSAQKASAVAKPMDSRALELLSEANQSKTDGDMKAVKSKLAMAVMHDEENPDVYYNSATLLHQAGLLEDAEMFLKSGVEKFPQHAGFPYGLGLLYAETDKMEMTVEQLEKAVELNPQFVRAWYNLSIAYAKLERIEDADRAMEAGRKAKEGEVAPSPAGAPVVEPASVPKKVPEALSKMTKIIDQPIMPNPIGRTWPNGQYVMTTKDEADGYTLKNKNIITVRGSQFTYDIYQYEKITSDTPEGVKAGDYALHSRYTGLVVKVESGGFRIRLKKHERLSCYPEGHRPVGVLQSKWPIFGGADVWTFQRAGDQIHDSRNRATLFQHVK